MASLMFKITNEDAPAVQSIRAEIPDALAAVIRRAMIKDANQRYQTGMEFASELREFLKA
jgi:serine/threonine-protein kinase